MDIAVWLRSLGLGKYEAVFRENEIRRDGSAEPDGGGPEGHRRRGPVGHRRKLLDAIAALRADARQGAPD